MIYKIQISLVSTTFFCVFFKYPIWIYKGHCFLQIKGKWYLLLVEHKINKLSIENRLKRSVEKSSETSVKFHLVFGYLF